MKANDNKALREALVNLVDFCSRLWKREKLTPLLEKARAALAKPPRNCALYDSMESARKAHEEYRSKYILAASNKFDFPMEFDDWLFATATEQKGE